MCIHTQESEKKANIIYRDVFFKLYMRWLYSCVCNVIMLNKPYLQWPMLYNIYWLLKTWLIYTCYLYIYSKLCTIANVHTEIFVYRDLYVYILMYIIPLTQFSSAFLLWHITKHLKCVSISIVTISPIHIGLSALGLNYL